MASYIVIIVLTINERVLKSAQWINEQLQKTSGADVLSPWKRNQKNLRGLTTTPPPLVRPRVNPYSKGLPSIVLVDICDFKVGQGVYLTGFRN